MNKIVVKHSISSEEREYLDKNKLTEYSLGAFSSKLANYICDRYKDNIEESEYVDFVTSYSDVTMYGVKYTLPLYIFNYEELELYKNELKEQFKKDAMKELKHPERKNNSIMKLSYNNKDISNITEKEVVQYIQDYLGDEYGVYLMYRDFIVIKSTLYQSKTYVMKAKYTSLEYFIDFFRGEFKKNIFIYKFEVSEFGVKIVLATC